MSSPWGSSWGTSWGDSWGAAESNPGAMSGSASFRISAEGQLGDGSLFSPLHPGAQSHGGGFSTMRRRRAKGIDIVDTRGVPAAVNDEEFEAILAALIAVGGLR